VEETKKTTKEKLLIRNCHSCLKINESYKELERCAHCGKAYLPLHYFDKIHHDKNTKWENYFYPTNLIEEDDLIKGLFVLW
jgi:hypothetical protein